MKRILFVVTCLTLALLALSCKMEGDEEEWVTVPLTVGVSTRADVVEFFGKEPNSYCKGSETYTVDTLPLSSYYMNYGSVETKDIFWAAIDNNDGEHIVHELRLEQKNEKFRCANGLELGLSSEEVFKIIGMPPVTKTDLAKDDMDWTDNVFNKNIDGTEGYHYYKDAVSGIRMFFYNNVTTAVYIFDITALETLK